MDRKLFIGDTVVLLREVLGNDAGTKGVVYEEYDLGDGPGASVIFENGNYDGFSVDDQKNFLHHVGHYNPCENYQFTNVMQLSRDFDAGFFNDAFI